jgi:hypothetical protein
VPIADSELHAIFEAVFAHRFHHLPSQSRSPRVSSQTQSKALETVIAEPVGKGPAFVIRQLKIDTLIADTGTGFRRDRDDRLIFDE